MIDAIIRIEGGGEPDPEALEDREQLGDFDYVFVGSVTADEIDRKDRAHARPRGRNLVRRRPHRDVHSSRQARGSSPGRRAQGGRGHVGRGFLRICKPSRRGRSHLGWYGRVEPMVDLAATFKPLDDLVYDYERIPETCIVDPNENDVEAGTQTTILIRDIVDLQGRSSAPFQRIMVEAKKGSILNGEPVAHMRVFEVGEGSVPDFISSSL